MGHSAREAARLDKQHYFFRRVMDDSLLAAPLNSALRREEIHRVLDVGTGTGIWCRDTIAEMREVGVAGPLEFVGSDVVENEYWETHGRHIRDLQNTSTSRASISFHVADLNSDQEMTSLMTPGGAFDLINSRMLISAVKAGNWPAYIKRMFSLLRPGGYIQLFEADMIDTNTGRSNDPTVAEALVITHAVYRGLGLDPTTAVQLSLWLHEAGFVAVRDIACWCYPTEQQANGTLKHDEVLQEWHGSAYQVLRPLFFKFRHSKHYASLLDKLPPQAYSNSPNGSPAELLATESAYDDFLQRHEQVLRGDPAYRTLFRVIVARRP